MCCQKKKKGMTDNKEALAKCFFTSTILGGFGLHLLTVHRRECVFGQMLNLNLV